MTMHAYAITIIRKLAVLLSDLTNWPGAGRVMEHDTASVTDEHLASQNSRKCTKREATYGVARAPLLARWIMSTQAVQYN